MTTRADDPAPLSAQELDVAEAEYRAGMLDSGYGRASGWAARYGKRLIAAAQQPAAGVVEALEQVLARDSEWSLSGSPKGCGCNRLSRQAEGEYERGECPHQKARAILAKLERPS